MQVLFYVLTFILALSILTMQSLNHYVEVYRVHLSYLKLMGKTYPETLRKRAYDLYNEIPNKSDQEGKKQAFPRLNSSFNLFLIREPSPLGEEYRQMVARLLKSQYGYRPTFEEIQQEFPDWEVLFVNELAESFQDPEKVKRLNNDPASIASLGLSPFSQKIIYNLSYADKGNEPLRSYLTITKRTNPKTSLYLAKRPLLEAILQSRELASEMIFFRKKLYQEFKDLGEKEWEVQKEAFEQRFRREFEPKVPQNFLPVTNFNLSKSSPS